jgi:hypothetical protein
VSSSFENGERQRITGLQSVERIHRNMFAGRDIAYVVSPLETVGPRPKFVFVATEVNVNGCIFTGV